MAIVAESWPPGASISDVARRHGLNRNLLGAWRRHVRQLAGGGELAFVPIRITEEPAVVAPAAVSTQQEGSVS